MFVLGHWLKQSAWVTKQSDELILNPEHDTTKVTSVTVGSKTWLRALAADMPLFKGLLNHWQVVVAVAGAEVISAEHTVGVHMQVKWPYQPCYLWLYKLKLPGRPTPLLITTHKRITLPHFHCRAVAQPIQYLREMYKSKTRREIRLHSPHSKLEPINAHQVYSLSIKRP